MIGVLPFELQTIPEGVPELLKPDFSKLDISKLRADIPKYPKAGIPREKMTFWQTIGEHLQGIEAKSREQILASAQTPFLQLESRNRTIHVHEVS